MGIENVQARVGEIQARIQSVLGTPNAQFQSILQDKLGVSQQTTTQDTADTASAQTALYNTLLNKVNGQFNQLRTAIKGQ